MTLLICTNLTACRASMFPNCDQLFPHHHFTISSSDIKDNTKCPRTSKSGLYDSSRHDSSRHDNSRHGYLHDHIFIKIFLNATVSWNIEKQCIVNKPTKVLLKSCAFLVEILKISFQICLFVLQFIFEKCSHIGLIFCQIVCKTLLFNIAKEL